MTSGAHRRRDVVRGAVLLLIGGYLLLPLVAMAEFSTRGDFGGRSLDSWTAIIHWPQSSVRSTP